MILNYEYPDWGMRTSLVYNYTGEYLTGVPATVGSPSIMREAYSSLDLVISKDFELWECDGSVKIKVGNVLDSWRPAGERQYARQLPAPVRRIATMSGSRQVI